MTAVLPVLFQDPPIENAKRQLVQIPIIYAHAESKVLQTWDELNDDGLKDTYFTRKVLDTLLIPAPPHPRPNYIPTFSWSSDALYSLIYRRCKEYLPDTTVELVYTRSELVEAYQKYRLRVRITENAQFHADKRDSRHANKVKIMNQLPDQVRCNQHFTSVSNFIRRVSDFQSKNNCSDEDIYIYIVNPRRISPVIYKVWEDENAEDYERTWPMFMKWLYVNYVKESKLLEIKKHILNMKQETGLKKFMDSVVAKRRAWDTEWKMANKYLDTIAIQRLRDDDIYRHLREGGLKSSDVTRMNTMETFRMTDWETMKQAAYKIARIHQPVYKTGLTIWNHVQTTDGYEIDVPSRKRKYDQTFSNTNERSKKKSKQNSSFTISKNEDYSRMNVKKLASRKKLLQHQILLINSAEKGESKSQSFMVKARNDNLCFKCGKPGHYKRDCLSTIPYTKKGRSKSFNCYNCGKYGHMARDCRQPKKPYSKGKKYGRSKSYGSTPPVTYVCRKCDQPGHWIQECPLWKNTSSTNSKASSFFIHNAGQMNTRMKNVEKKLDSLTSETDGSKKSKVHFSKSTLLSKCFPITGVRYNRMESLKFRAVTYGSDDRTVTMNIENYGIQQVYLDGGSTIDIIDRTMAKPFMHLAVNCKSFGINTAGGDQIVKRYIPLKVKVGKSSKIIPWYLLENIDLPHNWILSRGSFKTLGWTDILVKLDDLNSDSSFQHQSHVKIEYEGDDGPWMENSYPINNNSKTKTESKKHVNIVTVEKLNSYYDSSVCYPYEPASGDKYKSLFGPHYDPRFDGMVTRERVKINEYESNGQIYELYMTYLRDPEVLQEFIDKHGDENGLTVDNVFTIDKENDEDDCITNELGSFEDFEEDTEQPPVNCGSISDPAISKQFREFLSHFPQAKHRLDIGCLPEEFEIVLKDGATPCYTAQYPSAYKWTAEMKKQCMDLLKYSFISHSKSNYQSAILFVPKPDGTWRMCFDYRKLNHITVRDNYKLPNMNDLFTKFSGNRYFSSIDMRSAYHNVSIKPSDRHKTAFITPFGLFE